MEPTHHQEQEYRLVSQAEFAREMAVSRAAVSQWKSNDILREDAFSRPGKKGKLKFELAVDQVRRNRDLGQSLGNGIGTRANVDQPAELTPPQSAPSAAETSLPASEQPDLLSAPSVRTIEPVAPSAPIAAPRAKPDTLQDMLVAARLEEQLRKNRLGAVEEAERQGLLIGSEDAREQMMRIAGMMMQIFEGSLTDFAAVIASEFGVPKRDVLHSLKAEFRNVRQTAMRKEQARQAEVDSSTVASVNLEA